MADKLWTDETVTTYFELWDGELSPDKPASRPNSAWITDPTEITLTVRKPDATSETLTLTGADIEATDRDGEWRARFNTDGGAGKYSGIWAAQTADGYDAVSVVTVSAKAQP